MFGFFHRCTMLLFAGNFQNFVTGEDFHISVMIVIKNPPAWTNWWSGEQHNILIRYWFPPGDSIGFSNFIHRHRLNNCSWQENCLARPVYRNQLKWNIGQYISEEKSASDFKMFFFNFNLFLFRSLCSCMIEITIFWICKNHLVFKSVFNAK